MMQVLPRDGLSARLLALFIALALLGLVAPRVARAAEPRAPYLTETTPSSAPATPASVTEPSILGEGEPSGVHSSVAGTGVLTRGTLATRVTKHPEYEIWLYQNDPTCTTAPVAEGTAGELEGAGIQVRVPQNSITTFYARQVDPTDSNPEHRSECSPGRTYWEGAIAPPGDEGPGGGSSGGGSGGESQGSAGSPATAPGGSSGNPQAPAAVAHPSPPDLRTSPTGTANDNTPLVAGSAPGAAAVRIFTTSDCSGPPVAKGSVAELEAGFKVQVADNVTVFFYGASVGSGGAVSKCSAPTIYTEDSTAPHTVITMGPASKTRKRTAIFRFTDTTGDAPGTAFRCKVGKGRWKPCSSPLRMRHLRPRRYVLQVKATDPAGNTDAKPARRRFKVVAHR